MASQCTVSSFNAIKLRSAGQWRKRVKPAGLFFSVYCLGIASASAGDIPADPFNSVMWKSMVQRFFPGDQVVFDSRVVVSAPKDAENQFHVPVTVDASALQNVEEIVAVADLNPIPHILSFRPNNAHAFIGFRVKLQQATPIHVGVRTSDGVWHIGGAYVDAAGGGCTAAAMAHGDPNWMRYLGETRAIARRSPLGEARMTLRMRHPMDTGLATGIPAFYMNRLKIENDAGQSIAELDIFEPVSENPTFTLKPNVSSAAQTLHVSARDTEGNVYGFGLALPAAIAQ